MHTNQIEIWFQKYIPVKNEKKWVLFWTYDTYDSLFDEGISQLIQEGWVWEMFLIWQ